GRQRTSLLDPTKHLSKVVLRSCDVHLVEQEEELLVRLRLGCGCRSQEMARSKLSIQTLVAEQFRTVVPVRAHWHDAKRRTCCVCDQLGKGTLTGARNTRKDHERLRARGSDVGRNLPRLEA